MKNSLSNKSDLKSDRQHTNKPSPISPNTGKHILAEFWHCGCNPKLLTSTEPLLTLLKEAVAKAGLTLVGQAVHEFGQHSAHEDVNQSDSLATHIDASPDAVLEQMNSQNETQTSGVTLTLLLAESHLCLHTWGEYQTVTLDVYVCNFSNENSSKADSLFESCLAIFKPKQHHVNSVSRQHQIPNN